LFRYKDYWCIIDIFLVYYSYIFNNEQIQIEPLLRMLIAMSQNSGHLNFFFNAK